MAGYTPWAAMGQLRTLAGSNATYHPRFTGDMKDEQAN
jgi:hypothetical protein